MGNEDTTYLLHELQVRQAEMETQNEELRRTQGELDASCTRYFDLYDLAPVGYLTLSPEGLILEANLTAAKLLGVEQADLVKQRTAPFILPEDQNSHYFRQKKLFRTGEKQVYELRLRRLKENPCWVRIEAESKKLGYEDAAACWAAISDITARKQAEEELPD
ncbi:MAG: PAS domain S-box protein [Coprothermobacterota bacterium]|jgi:PAS domain S-box-containing protein|nr:PAS domain S-box protein [Coprothermobacterota bacterium]